eukprot:gene3944-4490_t
MAAFSRGIPGEITLYDTVNASCTAEMLGSKKLSEEQIKEFREAFLVFDRDGDGTVTVSEIGLVMKSLGQNPTEAEIKSMVQEVDTKGQGEIDFDDFCVLMQRMSGDGGEDTYDETKETFKVFDNQANDKVRVSDLKKVLESLSIKLTSSELSGVLEEMGSVGSELNYSVTLALAISGYCFGVTWTVIFGLSVAGVLKITDNLKDGAFEERTINSFENLYCDDESSAKKKRMFAKRKENHLKRNNASSKAQEEGGDTDNNLDSNTTRYFYDSLSAEALETLEFSMAEDFDFTTKMPPSNGVGYNSNNVRRQQVPSLRSPQPLISAVKSRICARDSLRESPSFPFGNKYPNTRQSREVFRDLQNAKSPQRPTGPSSYVLGSPHFSNDPLMLSPGRSMYKAISPPSGKYFSRINPEKSGQNFTNFLSPILDSKSEATWSANALQKEQNSRVEDTCSTEAVVKALKERVSSKRKRNLPSVADLSFDTTIDQPAVSNKKRKVDHDASSRNEKPSNASKDIISTTSVPPFTKPSTMQTIEQDTAKTIKLEKSQIHSLNEKSKYGIDEDEMDELADDGQEEMDLCKKQNKRKAEKTESTAKKGKQDVERKAVKTKQSSSLSRKTTSVKKTPVKSVETQTPSKSEVDSEKEKSIAKTPKQLKTPYRKIFTSGFPSNLKPESTEKRRRIPIYFMSAGSSENIEISREEYGEYGVTSDAFQANNKIAADRVKEMLDDSDNQATTDAKSSTSTLSTPSQISFGTSTTQPTPAISVISSSNAASKVTLQTTPGFTIVSKTIGNSDNNNIAIKPNIFGNQVAIGTKDSSSNATSSNGNTTNAAKPVITASGFNFGSPATVSSTEAAKPFGNILCTAVAATTSMSGSITTTAGGQLGFSLTTAAKPVDASQQSSVGFGLPGQLKSTSGSSGSSGFTFGKPVSGDSASIPSTGFNTTTFGGVATASGVSSGSSTSTSSVSASGFPATSFGTATTALNTGAGTGIVFGTSALAGNAQLPSSSMVPSLNVAGTVTTASQLGGFSFGIQGGAKQDAPKPFAMPGSQTSAASTPSNAATSLGAGFSFGTPSSAQKPAATVGGFNFGNAQVTPSSNTGAPSFTGFNVNPASSSLSSGSNTGNTGGFSFGGVTTSTTPQTAATVGGFSFGNKPTTTTTSAGFGGFNFSASSSLSSTTPSQSAFTFGKASTSISSQLPTPFGNPASSATQSSSSFQSTASTQMNSGSLFNPGTSAVSTPANLFGQTAGLSSAATSSNLFGAKPQTSASLQMPGFGAAPTSQPAGGGLFGASSQVASSTQPFGTPSTSTTSLFGQTSAQNLNTGTSILFGAPAQPVSQPSIVPQFGAQSTQSQQQVGFSFGAGSANKGSSNLFASGLSSSSSTGSAGFSFTNSVPQNNNNAASSAQNAFGQQQKPASTGFNFTQQQSNVNPFNATAFGQTGAASSSSSATASGNPFAFGQSTAANPPPSQPAFGSSSTPAFGSGGVASQGPASGGFNFGAASLQKPGGFSFSSVQSS